MELQIKERTALVLLKDHPELANIDREAKKAREDARKKIDELEKMAKHIAEQCNSTTDKLCDEMDTILKGLGVLPSDYNTDRYDLSVKHGAISIEPAKTKCDCLICSLAGRNLH